MTAKTILLIKSSVLFSGFLVAISIMLAVISGIIQTGAALMAKKIV